MQFFLTGGRLWGPAFVVTTSLVTFGCGGSATDSELNTLIDTQNLAVNPALGRSLPDIEDPIPQLGKQLFFSKSLGGGFDSACVSCHHPVLGGADQLSLSVGVEALNPDHLGLGRENSEGIPLVPRNAPTVFNVGLADVSLFWDSRVESLGAVPTANGTLSEIRTPDSDFLTADPNAGPNLAAAQARFPVLSVEEMKTTGFETNSDSETIRDHLAARIGNYGVGAGEISSNQWLPAFQEAFDSDAGAEELVSFDNITFALGEYERSMVFTNSPWQQYIDGDLSALDEDAKQGAILFLTPAQEGGAGCSVCHTGPTFSDSRHHTLAFPQIGPGAGDGPTGDDDLGRERETGNPADRWRFRTPSLLNVAVTAPYGHAGAFQNLEAVVRHYVNPNQSIQAYFANGGWCQLPQFNGQDDCGALYPNAQTNTMAALRKLNQEVQGQMTPFVPPQLDDEQIAQLVAFLEALTDPCVENRDCLAPWIPVAEDALDEHQLNAVNAEGELL